MGFILVLGGEGEGRTEQSTTWRNSDSLGESGLLRKEYHTGNCTGSLNDDVGLVGAKGLDESLIQVGPVIHWAMIPSTLDT